MSHTTDQLDRQKKDLAQSQSINLNATLKSNLSKASSDTLKKAITFKVAKPEPDVYAQFIDDIVYGSNRKQALMTPIPFGAGQLKFTISRNKSGLNKLSPYFTLFLEKPLGVKVPILYGKKRLFNKLANYIITLDQKSKERDDNKCLGKLRAIGDNDKFTLYDNGENFQKLNSYSMSQLRSEFGTFLYRYEPCNVGNIRKMMVLLPTVYPVNMSEGMQERYDKVADMPEAIYTFAASNPKLKFTQNICRPTKVSNL